MPSDHPAPARTIAWAILRVNAFNALNARGAALDCADPSMFSTRIAVSAKEADELRLQSPLEKSNWGQTPTFLETPGAWEVEASLFTEDTPFMDEDHTCTMLVHAVRHMGPSPHLDPHGEDRPEHWAAARLALAERDALQQTSQVTPTAPRAKPHAL